VNEAKKGRLSSFLCFSSSSLDQMIRLKEVDG
jgi:hypothetical protein